MESKKETVETTEQSTIKEVDEKTFTQDDVNNIVAKNVKEEMAKALKKLGVEDFDNAKIAVDEYSKLQEAQKTELDKALETTGVLQTEVSKWKDMYQNKDLEVAIADTLLELEVDTKHKDVLIKLIDNEAIFTDKGLDREVLKTQLTEIIEDKLPMLREQPSTKVGVENKATTPNKQSSKSFLDEKYKNNPFYKG